MTTDQLVKDALAAVADQAMVPDGLAHRAWRERTRVRVTTTATATAALVAAVGAVVIALPSLTGHDTHQVATGVVDPAQTSSPVPTMSSFSPGSSGGVWADPDVATPLKRVGAGRVTLTAYASCTQGKDATCSWSMLDSASGSYTPTPWGWIAVSPTGGTAAVLEKQLPARRVGLLDTATGDVTRWIDLERTDAGSLAWSPDGRRLLITAYGHDPGIIVSFSAEQDAQKSRTGFYIVDVDRGTAAFHTLPDDPNLAGLRADLSWSGDGSLVWEETGRPTQPRAYYDLDGKPATGPDQEASSDQPAGISPDGRYLARAGKMNSAPFVVQLSSGETTLLQPPGDFVIHELLAWADDTQLIAWATDRGTGDGAKPRFRLVLVDAEGKQVTPLTGATNDLDAPNWLPAFTTTGS